MNALLLVMAGGAIGSGARYLVGRATLMALGPAWPWGTLTVNLTGGFAMGLLVAVLVRAGTSGETWRLLIGVGILGGFTTFSAFALDSVTMIQRGDLASAVGYVLVSVVGSIAALFAGLALVRAVAA